jgi:hypothetical protein
MHKELVVCVNLVGFHCYFLVPFPWKMICFVTLL